MQKDQFERSLGVFIQPLELDEEEEAEYREVMTTVMEGREINTSETLKDHEKFNNDLQPVPSTNTRLNNKVTAWKPFFGH